MKTETDCSATTVARRLMPYLYRVWLFIGVWLSGVLQIGMVFFGLELLSWQSVSAGITATAGSSKSPAACGGPIERADQKSRPERTLSP